MSKGGKAWRGYFGVGEELTSGKIDLKEGIYFGQELEPQHPKVQNNLPLHGQNLFPDQPAQLKSDVLSWLKEMDRLGGILIQAIAESLNLPRLEFSNTTCKEHLGLLRIFHYPIDNNDKPELWAVGEHTDYGLLTLLMISDKGLQVKNRDNEWVNVDPIPNTFVINIGDILERMTRGLYKSTPHRAKNVQGKSRYSVPYFYDPNWDAEIKELDIKVSEE
jgi:isopenicillin N synthase-like dioxygenase